MSTSLLLVADQNYRIVPASLALQHALASQTHMLMYTLDEMGSTCKLMAEASQMLIQDLRS